MYVLSGDPINQRSSDLAKGFLEYVRGLHGQAILEQHNFYTYFDRPDYLTVIYPDGFGTSESGLPVLCTE